MLTRLRVSGFKNLVDLDVRFGPFTCVAGPNGVGKSNLFDAIRFLSNLATMTLAEAALSVRDEDTRSTDVRSLFHRTSGRYAWEMSLEAEMLLPREAMDDLGQKAPATMTFARYRLVLGLREDSGRAGGPGLEIRHEELTHIPTGTAPKHLSFPHSKSKWRDSVLHGRRQRPFISTSDDVEQRVIRLHQDGGSRGRQVPFPAATLPRTVLSSTAAESPTALVARREMESWRLLQLEPSAMRKPDSFNDPDELGADGSQLAATLYRLSRGERWERGNGREERESRVHGQVANRLSELVEEVAGLRVDRDERRELLTVHVRMRDGTEHPARALSDGTLRFLALSVLELDPQCRGLLCLEEPENGIHPERIPAMLSLLKDTDEPVGDDNPLRQVIVNTHSPAVVSQVPEDSLLVAESRETVKDGGERFDRLSCSCLPDTWRAGEADASEAPLGKLLSYLNQVLPENEDADQGRPGASRVIDRPDVQMLLPFDGHEEVGQIVTQKGWCR